MGITRVEREREGIGEGESVLCRGGTFTHGSLDGSRVTGFKGVGNYKTKGGRGMRKTGRPCGDYGYKE